MHITNTEMDHNCDKYVFRCVCFVLLWCAHVVLFCSFAKQSQTKTEDIKFTFFSTHSFVKAEKTPTLKQNKYCTISYTGGRKWECMCGVREGVEGANSCKGRKWRRVGGGGQGTGKKNISHYTRLP